MTAQVNVNEIFYKLTWVCWFTTHAYALHVDTTAIADGRYKLVPESESEQHEAQVNLTEVAEDSNQSSEEPKANFAQEGKPRSITPIFKTMQCCNFIYLCI
jgi:hypothetical protein